MAGEGPRGAFQQLSVPVLACRLRLVEDGQGSQQGGFEGRVADSGEGRWTINAAIDEGVPVDVLAAALFARFRSRGQDDFQNRLLSAMRYEFGGHVEKKA